MQCLQPQIRRPDPSETSELNLNKRSSKMPTPRRPKAPEAFSSPIYPAPVVLSAPPTLPPKPHDLSRQGGFRRLDISPDEPELDDIAEAFSLIDADVSGDLSRAEVIKACRTNERVRMLLSLPKVIRQDDRTRDAFEAIFKDLDSDNSGSITLDEFRRCVTYAPAPSTSREMAYAQGRTRPPVRASLAWASTRKTATRRSLSLSASAVERNRKIAAGVKLALGRLDPDESFDPEHAERATLTGIAFMRTHYEQTELTTRTVLEHMETDTERQRQKDHAAVARRGTESVAWESDADLRCHREILAQNRRVAERAKEEAERQSNAELRARLVALAQVSSDCLRELSEQEVRIRDLVATLRSRMESLDETLSEAQKCERLARRLGRQSHSLLPLSVAQSSPGISPGSQASHVVRSSPGPRVAVGYYGAPQQWPVTLQQSQVTAAPSMSGPYIACHGRVPAPSTTSLIHEASQLAISTKHGMVGLATRHRRALSELQQAAKMWHARRVQSADRRGWVNPSDLSVGDHVSLPAFSDEHVRINEMLIRDGIADFYRRATEDPRTLSQVLELVQLTVETDGARLRIRDTHTSEVCLDWTPGRQSFDRPSTDPGMHRKVVEDHLLMIQDFPALRDIPCTQPLRPRIFPRGPLTCARPVNLALPLPPLPAAFAVHHNAVGALR